MVVNKLDSSVSLSSYLFPSAWSRFFARLVDLFIISAITISLGITILITDYKFSWQSLELGQPIRYFFVSLVGLVFSSFFFLCFPMLFGWQTIGMKIFKLKFYFENKKKNIFFSLLKHELFVWIIIVLISLVVGLTFSLINYHDLKILNKSMTGLVQKSEDQNTLFYYLGLVFKYFYYVFFLVFFSIVINLFAANKKPLWHDKFSHLLVVKISNASKETFSKTKKGHSINEINYDLPGDVNSSLLDQLESDN